MPLSPIMPHRALHVPTPEISPVSHPSGAPRAPHLAGGATQLEQQEGVMAVGGGGVGCACTECGQGAQVGRV